MSTFHDSVERFIRMTLQNALIQCDGNRSRAAELLGLQRTYLMALLRKYGITHPPPQHWRSLRKKGGKR